MQKEIIFNKLKETLVSNFQIDADKINPENHLEKDLGLDSLDLVDILIYLKDHTCEKADPVLLKNARTVQNVVDLLEPVWK